MTTSTSTSTLTTSGLRIERRDRIGLVQINLPDQPQNTLRPELGYELERAIEELESDGGVDAIVLGSAKPGSFLAGADVKLLNELDDKDEATTLARDAQQLTSRIAACSKPVVAAIQGACLGAGLELALACDGRVASGDEETRLGSPEVQLGLVPAAGGTQRLPQVVGLVEALELVTTGSDVPAAKARKMGLVDEVVHPEIVVDAAAEQALKLASAKGDDGDKRGSRGRLGDRARALALERNPVGRKMVFQKAVERVEKQTRGNMPAPVRAVELVRIGVEEGMETGLDAEARAFGELAVTSVSRNLRGLFLDREAAKHTTYTEAKPRRVGKVAVIGAGLMGAGIAEVTANKAGLPVRLRDVGLDEVRQGMSSISAVIHDIRRLDEIAARQVLGRITATTDGTGFRDADLAIEAVVEKLDVKLQVFEQIEAALPEHAVIATNTSALPLDQLARGLQHPERLVGMHYFSPVGRVPLLEVVQGTQTDPSVLATAIEVGRKQGKTVIVVSDSPGFYSSRILGRYLNEAAHQAAEGVPIERVDDALEKSGFAVGPFRLLEDVGIDIAYGTSVTLYEAFGDRFRSTPVLERLVEDDRKGAKNGRGIYAYSEKKGQPERTDAMDPAVRDLIGAESTVQRPPDEIAERCIRAMADEAKLCLDEGVVRSSRDGDLGAVLGLGFPPHLGGPFRYLENRG